MRKTLMQRIVSFILIAVMSVMCLSNTAMAAWDVKRGTVDYYVEMNDSNDLYLCNKLSVGTKVGTEYYMTYTVADIDTEKMVLSNQGVLGTNVPNNSYPYLTSEDGKEGGYYRFENANKFLMKGHTYFIKFTITKDGYKYRASWAKGKLSKYFEVEAGEAGTVKTNLSHFGVWFGGSGITGRLEKIRFYDKDGNDLGAHVTAGRNAFAGREKPFAKDKEVAHTYKVILKDAYNVALSNRRQPTSDTVYMEYRVDRSKGSHIYQTGVIHSNSPAAGYPYLSGFMNYNRGELDPKKVDGGELLTPGAEYLIIFERKEDMFLVTAQKTLNGKVSFLNFEYTVGVYDSDSQYFSVWYGEGMDFKVNAVLTDFKCYDSNKNNLGVQCNGVCEIIHYGELEDYSGCQAMYFCDEDESLYALYEDKSLKFTDDGVTKKGTYQIEEELLTTRVGDSTNEFDFMYRYFINKEQKKYRRLHSYKLKFDTGEGNKVETQVLNADNGYMPIRPSDPSCEGNAFEGWYTPDGEEYHFDKIVTDSLTLYAKWEKVEYTDANIKRPFAYMPQVAISIVILILIAAIVSGVCIVKRGNKNGDND